MLSYIGSLTTIPCGLHPTGIDFWSDCREPLSSSLPGRVLPRCASGASRRRFPGPRGWPGVDPGLAPDRCRCDGIKATESRGEERWDSGRPLEGRWTVVCRVRRGPHNPRDRGVARRSSARIFGASLTFPAERRAPSAGWGHERVWVDMPAAGNMPRDMITRELHSAPNSTLSGVTIHEAGSSQDQ